VRPFPLSDEGAHKLVVDVGRRARAFAVANDLRGCALELDTEDGRIEVRWRRRDDDLPPGAPADGVGRGSFWLTVWLDDGEYDPDVVEGEPQELDPRMFDAIRDPGPSAGFAESVGDAAERWLSEQESDDPPA
jgi:hypothetical protein